MLIFLVSKLSDSVPLNITETLCVISNNSSKSWDKTIIEVPFLAKLINDSLIANSAPASIPQVGCEIINNFGLVKISLPITNFWRFPPDKLDALTSGPGVTTLNWEITLFTWFSIFWWIMTPFFINLLFGNWLTKIFC